jgi:mRNA interferase MazF
MVDLDPVLGSEQGRRRPVLVIQAPELARATTTFLCVPLTTNLARLGLPGTRAVRKGEGGLSQDSVALGFHLRALDRSRFGRRLGSVSAASVRLIVEGILEALGVEVRP